MGFIAAFWMYNLGELNYLESVTAGTDTAMKFMSFKTTSFIEVHKK